MASSAQEPFEWDEDPAWSRPDPMTAEEREAWLDLPVDHPVRTQLRHRTHPVPDLRLAARGRAYDAAAGGMPIARLDVLPG